MLINSNYLLLILFLKNITLQYTHIIQMLNVLLSMNILFIEIYSFN